MARRRARHFLRDASGATAVEYGLIIAAIAAVVVGIIFRYGLRFEHARNEVGQVGPTVVHDVSDGGGDDAGFITHGRSQR